MITVRPGSHVHRLITVLGLAGEYPVRSLGVLGNERTLRALVGKLSTTQELRNPDTGERMRVKLLQLTGIGNAKAIRFCKGALPILEWIHPDAYGYYMAAFYNHRFPGGMAHRDRNLRVAETIGMHLTAGIETRAYLLPALQNRAILRITSDAPSIWRGTSRRSLLRNRTKPCSHASSAQSSIPAAVTPFTTRGTPR